MNPVKQILLIILLLSSAKTYANHIYGGELLYTNISGNTYNVTLTFYGDCSADPTLIASLYNNTPFVYVYRDQTLFQKLTLQPANSTGVEVSPVCPGQISNTSCNGGTLPGVRKFTFSTTVTLSGPYKNWRFIFPGFLPPMISAGRSHLITNISNAGNTIIYLEATLNNVNGPNSSPQYSTIPTPFYCINVAQSYNQGALDPDNDSLVYSLVPALDSVGPSTGASVIYNSPFTAVNPLSSVGSTFNFNVLNGQLNFTPDITQDALIVTQVSEYRNGVLVGRSSRELTFIVLDNCTAPPPTAVVKDSTVSNGVISHNGIFYICQGNPNVAFDINANSASKDTVVVTISNTLPNSTVTISNDSTDSPVIHFVWNTDTVKPGVYNFYATLKANHCPIASTQTYAYTIYVIRPNTDTGMQLTATGCVHKAKVEYDFKYGQLPRTVTVTKGAENFGTFTDSTGKITDSLYAGKYVIKVTSPYLACPSYYILKVVDSGALPAPYNYNFAKCLYDKEDTIKFLPFAGSHVVWHNLDGTLLPGSPTPNDSVTGKQRWYVIQSYNVCVSYADTVTVTVNPLPYIKILNGDGAVCLGDKIYFRASGGEDYKWKSTMNKLFIDTGGVYTNTLLPDTYFVSANDTNGCINKDSVHVDSITQCCRFSYPNTFTPNLDNINDDYHVVIYGNTDVFELTIFDRWGERVYHSFNPKQGWDGTYHNQRCQQGSYYYYMRAHCLTGHDEVHKGQILLYR
jgi:gliding motility-associated-like protein